MGKRAKLFLIIPTLQGGGAERIVQLLAEKLPQDRYSVKVVLFNNVVAFKMPDHVEIVCLNKRSEKDFFKLVTRLSQEIDRDKPDAMIGFMTYVNIISLLAVRKSRFKPRVIVTEHNYLPVQLPTERWAFIKLVLIRRLYRSADKIVCVSRASADHMASLLKVKVDTGAIDVAHPSVALETIDRLGQARVEHPWFASKDLPVILSAGRLSRQKGYDVLLKAFSILKQKIPCRLAIIGEGPERGHLAGLAQGLGISGDAALLGFQENPYSFMSKSDVFVLSSLWEGFPTVLLEAMACGVPVVASDCWTGPREIVTHGRDGFLVKPKDAAGMADMLEKLLKDKELRASTGTAGKMRVKDFGIEKMVAKYDEMLMSLAVK